MSKTKQVFKGFLCIALIFVMTLAIFPGITPGAEASAFEHITSSIVLPDRRLTPTERAEWIAEYNLLGGPSAFEREVVRLINVERTRLGLVPVQIDNTSMQAARFYAQQLANLNLPLGHHEGPYGGSPFVAGAFGVPWTGMCGSAGHRTPQEVVNGWMNSPGHRAIIVTPAQRFVGVGSQLNLYRTSTIGWDIYHYMMFSHVSSTPTTQPAPRFHRITAQPMDNVSGSISVAATVQGATLSYQWFQNTISCNRGGTAIPGATGTTLNASANLAGPYFFVEVRASGVVLPIRSVVSRISIPVGNITNIPTGTGWVQSGSTWFFYSNNVRVTGWLNDGGVWYYMHSNGAMATGWLNDGGTWYYMLPSGAMATGWVNDGGTWYFMHPSGAMATGWVNDGGVWYYMHPSGAMATGWVNDGGTWYFMHPCGAMATGWLIIGGVWNWFYDSGAWWGTY